MKKDSENNENEEVVFEPDMEDVAFDDEVGTKDKLKKLREDLKKCSTERQEYLTGWQRAQADYVNLKKEMSVEFSRGKTVGSERLVESILPVLDSFDMAMGNAEAWNKVDENWRKGIEFIHSQFLNALMENNVIVIDKTGVPFNPLQHQAIENVETDDASKDHTIESIIQKGYVLGDRTIRPARVKVFIVK